MQDVLSRIGRYDIKGRIGGGGMGTLYLARDTNPTTPRLVAVKLLRTSLDSEDLRKRFQLEAQSLAQLSHQNIVVIFDSGEYQGSPYIVMEFVRGETLAELIGRKVHLSLGQKLRLLSELCTGLSHAHDAGIIHRDIKPANLMVDRDGPLKILDFGIARVDDSGQSVAGGPLTQLNMRVGTPGYMSPEQIESGEIDTRSDLFAVGAVAYELITYRQAFPGATTRQVENKVLNDEPAPLEDAIADLDPEIGIVVQSALEKDRTRRCPDAATLAGAFDRLRAKTGDDGHSIRSTPTPKHSSEPRKRSERNAEIAFERAVVARQDGADELARRSAMEALAELPEHAGAIDLLKALGRFEDVRPWLSRQARHDGRPLAETEVSGGDVRKPTEIYDKLPTPARPPSPRSRRGLVATVAAAAAVVVIAIMAYALWPSPPATVKLTIDRPIGGTIRVGDFECRPESETCAVDIPVGQRVVLVPAGGPGFEPTGFTGACVMRGEVVMTAATTCGVTFGPTPVANAATKVYRLTVEQPQGGTIEGSGIVCGPGSRRCSREFQQPTEVELRYRVETGYRFVGWKGECDSRGAVWVDGVVGCTPMFTENTVTPAPTDPVSPSKRYYSLRVEPPLNGTVQSVSGHISCRLIGDKCQVQLAAGTGVELTANPDRGYRFDGFSGDCATRVPRSIFTMRSDVTCTATFSRVAPPPTPPTSTPITVPLTLVNPSSGTIRAGSLLCRPESRSCRADIPVGQLVTVVGDGGPGFEVTGFTGACNSRGEVTMTAAATCGVTFGATAPRNPVMTIVSRLTVERPRGGTIEGFGISCGPRSDKCTVEVPKPTEVELRYQVEPGYAFGGWEGACDINGTVRVVGSVRCEPIFLLTRIQKPSDSRPPTAEVRNLTFEVQADRSVHFSYDLVSNVANATFNVEIAGSTDGGRSYSLKPQGVSGDLVGVKPGRQLKIVWRSIPDLKDIEYDQLRFRIMVSSTPVR